MSNKPNADPDILAMIDQSSLRPRATLRSWMQTNHDAFAARLKTRSPDWNVLAGVFEKAGLTDRYGKAPKAETARKTWYRAKQDVTKLRAAKSAQTTAAAAARSRVKPPMPAVRVDEEQPTPDEAKPHYDFDFDKARIRKL